MKTNCNEYSWCGSQSPSRTGTDGILEACLLERSRTRRSVSPATWFAAADRGSDSCWSCRKTFLLSLDSKPARNSLSMGCEWTINRKGIVKYFSHQSFLGLEIQFVRKHSAQKIAIVIRGSPNIYVEARGIDQLATVVRCLHLIRDSHHQILGIFSLSAQSTRDSHLLALPSFPDNKLPP